MTFKIGDTVKQIRNVSSYENPLVIILEISKGKIHHRHHGSDKIKRADIRDFVYHIDPNLPPIEKAIKEAVDIIKERGKNDT